MPPALLRLFYRVAAPLGHVYWTLTRASPRGAKLLLVCGAEVLLIRHTYGNRRVWNLPGGLLHRGEEPEVGARRELLEELGLEAPASLRELCVRDMRFMGHVDRVHFYVCMLDGRPELELSRAEIAEASWFAASDPPRPLGREVREVLALLESPAGKPGSPSTG